jgi:hypothetical protein
MENPMYTEPKKDNPQVIIWTVLATIGAVLIIGGAFFWGQNWGKSTGSSSSSVAKLSLSIGSSSSVSSSSSVTVSSSSASSSVAPTLNKTYVDSDYTNFSIKYDDTWTLDTATSGTAFVRKTVSFTKVGNGSKVTINLDNSGHGTGALCLSSDQLLDIGGGWSRLRGADGIRYFNKTASFNTTPPFPIPEVGATGDCPAGTVAVGGTYIDIPDTALSQAHIDGIKLDVVGDDRTIADEMIKTISY